MALHNVELVGEGGGDVQASQELQDSDGVPELLRAGAWGDLEEVLQDATQLMLVDLLEVGDHAVQRAPVGGGLLVGNHGLHQALIDGLLLAGRLQPLGGVLAALEGVAQLLDMWVSTYLLCQKAHGDQSSRMTNGQSQRS